jgi:hypothetical protein
MAALRGDATAVLDARITVLETARKRALRMIAPQDVNLYRDREGTTTGYISDAGMQRVRDVLGVEVYNVTTPEKVALGDGSFMYIQSASGRSKLTTQVVEDVEGGRSSSEDFCKDAREANRFAELELLVRKATRANVNGNVCRELMGLKNVPLQELQDAWAGTNKDWTQCRKARGFGSQAERLGATKAGVPDVPPPTCPVCKTPDGSPLPLEYRPASGTRRAFYGCRNYSKHPKEKVIVNADEWVGQAKRAPQERIQDDENNRLDAEIAAREGSK